jgi:hypothetical protein
VKRCLPATVLDREGGQIARKAVTIIAVKLNSI